MVIAFPLAGSLSRLYELGVDEIRLVTYFKRWWQWMKTGVDGFLSVGDRSVWGWVGALRDH